MLLPTWPRRSSCSLTSEDPEREINVYVYSPGGLEYSGLGVYDPMQYVSRPEATICVGLAASFGSVLRTAGAKGRRASLPNSRMLLCQPRGGAQGQASDIEIRARQVPHAVDFPARAAHETVMLSRTS